MVKYIQDECTNMAEELGTSLLRTNINSKEKKKKQVSTVDFRLSEPPYYPNGKLASVLFEQNLCYLNHTCKYILFLSTACKNFSEFRR